jgi:crossover junction endodeoxyribonuclease RuvC
MSRTRKSPVAVEAADWASGLFCSAAEHSENSPQSPQFQAPRDVSPAAMDAVVLGIDPGALGAISVLTEAGQLLGVFDMPSTTEANGRTATNAPLLASFLARTHARVAYCEFVGARPTDAKVAAFSFGRARGVIEGVCGALSIPIVFLAPASWKRLADIPPGVENKDLARTRAIARWPAHADLFARKCDVDRAEACLIALAGLQRRAGRG